MRLRQGYYAFLEYKQKPDYSLYFADRIYKLFSEIISGGQ